MSFRYEPLPHYEAHSSTSVGLGQAGGAGLALTADLTALTLARDLLEGPRVDGSDEARRHGTLDREPRLVEHVQLRVQAVVQVSRRLLVQAGVYARP